MLLLLLLPLVAVFASAGQLPFAFDNAGGAKSQRKPGEPEDLYIKHFSRTSVDTGVALQAQLEALYANSSVLTTTDPFNLLGFARKSGLNMRERRDLVWFTQRGFMPARSSGLRPDTGRFGSIHESRFDFEEENEYRLRPDQTGNSWLRVNLDGVPFDTAGKGGKDEHGFVYESIQAGAWEVRWDDTDVLAIVAQYPAGFGIVTQWHLISPSSSASDSLFAAVADSTAIPQPEVVWVFDHGYWQPSRRLWLEVKEASWDDVILDEDFKKRLRSDYGEFLKSKKTYHRLGIPWKRGLIFLGPPGNGKTSALKAIMGEITVPSLYVRTLAGFGPPEGMLSSIFNRARMMSPCLLIFEDLDSIIDDETRSYFLNEVDGIENNDGILMIGTTNHFDRLDPGLSNRPSRFDRKYTFPNPSRTQRGQYAEYWRDKLKDADGIRFPKSLIDDFAAATSKFSFAYMKEAFVSTLLRIAGKDDGGKEGSKFPELLLKEVKHLRKELDDGDDKGDKDRRPGRKGLEQPFMSGGSEARKIVAGAHAEAWDEQQQERRQWWMLVNNVPHLREVIGDVDEPQTDEEWEDFIQEVKSLRQVVEDDVNEDDGTGDGDGDVVWSYLEELANGVIE